VKPRYLFLDSLRGFALLLMLAYHFSFDLDAAGAMRIDMRTWFWVGFRTLILVLFLGLVGVGTALSRRTSPSPRRVAVLAACAGVITLATRLLFPQAWVFFGVLHFILVTSFVAPVLARWPRLCLPTGLALAALPLFVRSAALDGGLRQLTGLELHRPHTVDFVPLCPWLGVVLAGIYVGFRLGKSAPAWLQRGDRRLAALGLWSLPVYMVHQALLLPIAWGLAFLAR
jgi:uncharacterized membrane protein